MYDMAGFLSVCCSGTAFSFPFTAVFGFCPCFWSLARLDLRAGIGVLGVLWFYLYLVLDHCGVHSGYQEFFLFFWFDWEERWGLFCHLWLLFPADNIVISILCMESRQLSVGVLSDRSDCYVLSEPPRLQIRCFSRKQHIRYCVRKSLHLLKSKESLKKAC